MPDKENNGLLENGAPVDVPQAPPKKTDAEHTEETLRAAGEVLKDKGIPYASAIAAGVDAADKMTGGRSTRLLAKGVTRANKMNITGGGRILQKGINGLNKSGITTKARQVNGLVSGKGGIGSGTGNASSTSTSSAKSSAGSDNLKATGTLKMPLPPKIIMFALIAFVPLFALMFFIVLFGNEEHATGGSMSGSGSYILGKTCKTVTVTDTENYIYDGDVSYEDYIAGVVAAEVGSANNLEYYKLVAIAVRTYFAENVSDSCEVKGNQEFRKYIDVDDSQYSALIRQAVAETNDLVITNSGQLVDLTYGYGRVTNKDENNYYISYGNAQTQTIPKSWAQNSIFKDYLESSEATNSEEYEMSLVGAAYLITNEGYTYNDVIKYYYTQEVEVIVNKMVFIGADGFINPTRRIHCSSPFGTRIHPVHKVEKFHSGLDIGIAGGEPIYAAKSGTVTKVVSNVNAINNCNYGYGNYVVIDHGDGSSTLYAHIKYGTVPSKIEVGTEVSQGEQIGQVGSTGCSTGNHLHYEVYIDGNAVDPAEYMDLTDATGTCKR